MLFKQITSIFLFIIANIPFIKQTNNEAFVKYLNKNVSIELNTKFKDIK